MLCDRRCIHRYGRWCDSCWREILRGGWHQADEHEAEEESCRGD